MTRASGRSRVIITARRREALLDHLTLVPASQLPFTARWRALVDGLPAGEVLLVVPVEENPLKRMARALVPHLRARGRHVTAVAATAFSRPSQPRRSAACPPPAR